MQDNTKKLNSYKKCKIQQMESRRSVKKLASRRRRRISAEVRHTRVQQVLVSLIHPNTTVQWRH